MATRTFSRTAVLIAAALGALSAPAIAADTASMAVQAVVTGTCKFTATTATLSFGTLDQASNAAATATAGFTYKCTSGVTAGTFTVGGADVGATGYSADLTRSGGTETMGYTITWTTPTAFTGDGFGTGSTGKSVTLNGSIPYNNYANAVAGTYNGSVNVVINN